MKTAKASSPSPDQGTLAMDFKSMPWQIYEILAVFWNINYSRASAEKFPWREGGNEKN